jgi:hypothetical protein
MGPFPDIRGPKRILSAYRIDELFNELNPRRGFPPPITALPNPTPDIEWVNVKQPNHQHLAMFEHGIPALEALLELQRDNYDKIRERLSYIASLGAYIPRWHAISNFFWEVACCARSPPHKVLVTLLTLSNEKINIIAEFAAAHDVPYHRCAFGEKSITWMLFKGNERPADAQDMIESIERAEALVLGIDNE